MSRSRCMVEIDEAGQVLRIFRHAKRAMELPPEKVRELPRSEAVSQIRHAIWLRSHGNCEYCGRMVTENGWTAGEMHEEVPRSKMGEISLENSKFICRKCHREDERGHASRRLHFGETSC